MTVNTPIRAASTRSFTRTAPLLLSERGGYQVLVVDRLTRRPKMLPSRSGDGVGSGPLGLVHADEEVVGLLG